MVPILPLTQVIYKTFSYLLKEHDLVLIFVLWSVAYIACAGMRVAASVDNLHVFSSSIHN